LLAPVSWRGVSALPPEPTGNRLISDQEVSDSRVVFGVPGVLCSRNVDEDKVRGRLPAWQLRPTADERVCS
jgi:hypothetical protein